jgi:hypothetical protein
MTFGQIDPPPKPGFYKLQIYARKKPRARGRLKIPLIANFLVDFRLNGGNNKSTGCLSYNTFFVNDGETK